MSTKKKSRLGKGLGALLGDVRQTTGRAEFASMDTKVAPEDTLQPDTGLREIPIEQLQRGKYQPRINIDKDALEELTKSIRVQGIIQPLLVRKISRDQFEIIAGERRWRGAQLAGLATVPAVVREVNDQTAMAVALIENIQREDLNAIEEANGLQRLLDEFGLTHQEVADAVGRSRTAVSNLLRLLSLHPEVRKLVETGLLEMGHARALLGIPSAAQPMAAKQVLSGRLSVRQTEQLVKTLLRGKKSKTGGAANNADLLRLEEELSSRIGAHVDIQHGRKKGKLIIHYHSLDELDGILEWFK
jgi:ParB family chromosome partitioning protein